jgi:choline dehydrogenase-like flavoprotein
MSLTIMRKPEPWDVIVVGSGATGGWAAHKLARHGLSVLVLEAGPDRADLPENSRTLADRVKRRLTRKLDQMTKRRQVQMSHPAYWELDPELFVVDTEHPYDVSEGKPFHWMRTRSLNGRMLTWGGIGVRTSDYEFHAPAQDGFGMRWPFDYSALERHYDEIDAALPVYGVCDGLPGLPDGHYVAAPKLSDSEHRFRAELAEKMPERRVIASRGVLVRPSSRPNGEPGPNSLIRDAITKHGANVRTNAVVSQILVDERGRATGVCFVDRLSKRTHEISARVVVLCASTLETTRILLNSTSAQHPDGLGNSSGALGRYLMDHPGIYLNGFLPGKRDVAWQDGNGGPKNIIIPRSHNLENAGNGEFLRGYGFFGEIGRHRATRALKKICDADEVPFHLLGYGEMLPRAENRVTLQRDRLDAWGIPILRIDCAFSENEHSMRRHMLASMEEMVHATGGRIGATPHYFEPGGFVHEVGTARMGQSPKDSVLNGFAQCWDAPNLFVMDGAAWPTAAWQNPTFTMMAIAGRACDYLASSLRARGLMTAEF